MNFRFSLKEWIGWAYFAALAAGTVLIMVRRWAWDQVPSQVPAELVLATLLVNSCWLALLAAHWVRRVKPTK